MIKSIYIFLIISGFIFSFNYKIYSEEEKNLTWEACVKEASKNNPEIISAQESINEKKADKNITKTSLFPQISAEISSSRDKIVYNKPDNTYSYGVSGTQLIFDGFKTINNINAANENLKAVKYNYSFVSSEVRLKLRLAFVELLKAQKLLKTAKEIYKIRKNSFELINLQYISGLEHKGALLTAKANVFRAYTELSKAKRDVIIAQRKLSKEMGCKIFYSIKINEEFSITNIKEENPDFEMLANKNPLYLEMTAKKNFALFGIKSTYGNFSPELSARLSASKTNLYWPPQDEKWSMELAVSMPLFEGGLKTAQLEKAKALYNKAEAEEKNTKNIIILDLAEKWALFKDAIAFVDVQKKMLEAIEERAKIASAQYSISTITFDNWNIIENDLVNTKKSWLEAKANAMISEANWIYAKGDTLEYVK